MCKDFVHGDANSADATFCNGFHIPPTTNSVITSSVISRIKNLCSIFPFKFHLHIVLDSILGVDPVRLSLEVEFLG